MKNVCKYRNIWIRWRILSNAVKPSKRNKCPATSSDCLPRILLWEKGQNDWLLDWLNGNLTNWWMDGNRALIDSPAHWLIDDIRLQLSLRLEAVGGGRGDQVFGLADIVPRLFQRFAADTTLNMMDDRGLPGENPIGNSMVMLMLMSNRTQLPDARFKRMAARTSRILV